MKPLEERNVDDDDGPCPFWVKCVYSSSILDGCSGVFVNGFTCTFSIGSFIFLLDVRN